MNISEMKSNSRSLLMGTILRVVLLFACLMCAAILNAQNYLTGVGGGSTASYPAEMGMVDATTGNLHLEIPLGSFPQRGGSSLVPKLVYDSHIWTVPTDGTSYVWTTQGALYGLAFGTWGFNEGGSEGVYQMARSGSGGCSEDVMLWSESGAQHYFNIYETLNGNLCSGGTAYATDSSGFQIRQTAWGSGVNATLSVFAPDGTEVFGSDLYNVGVASKDPNGNYLGLTYANASAPGIYNPVIDTLGRNVVSVLGNNYNSPMTLQVMNSAGGRSNYVITFQTVSVNTNFGESGVTECNSNCTIEVITGIGLPDGSSYSFLYDCNVATNGTAACNSPSGQSAYYGTLTSMTLPTGQTVNYGYVNFTDSLGGVGRWLNTKAISGVGGWWYNPSSTGGTGQHVNVFRPDRSEDSISLTVDGSGTIWPTQVVSYDTDETTVLSTVNNTWDFSVQCTTILCGIAVIEGIVNGTHVSPHQDIRKLSTSTTLPIPGGSITKQTTYAYDSPLTGNVTAVKDWKYQWGTSPTFSSVPDRAVNISYATIGTNNNINRPHIITVTCNTVSDPTCTGAGSTVAQTTITYDSYSGGSGCSTGLTLVQNIANHDDTNFGCSDTARGNPTQISKWVNSSTSVSTSSTNYDTTGQVLASTDPSGNVTNYFYSPDSFYNDNGSDPATTFSPAKATNAYVVKVTDNIGTTTAGYYYGSGRPAVTVDYDGLATYSHYVNLSNVVDPFDRLTKTDFPIGWGLNVYTSPTEYDSYSPVFYTGAAAAGCTGCSHSESLLDSLGRVTSDSLVNNPAGQPNVNYGYDALNRVITTSHPNFGSSDPNDVLETQYYDGLGRSLVIKHPDGQLSRVAYGALIADVGGVTTQQSSATTYGYGYPVASLDESGRQRQEWIDGFGHVIEVDETSATTSTPATGSVTISLNSGQWSYTYNACPNGCQVTVYNSGYVFVTVNGFTAQAYYQAAPSGYGSTTQSVASDLASQFSVPASPVTAIANGGSVTLSAVAGGVSTDFSVTTSASYTNEMCGSSSCFSGPAFTASSPTTLSGGSGGIDSSPLVTSYTYDALGNLTKVVQGSQTRTWTYDGLSRLTQEVTPEAGTVTLSYLNTSGSACSGNPSSPCSRTAPAPNQTGSATVVTTYTYDTANRLTKKSYSDSTKTVTYAYRTTSQGIGLLFTITDPSGGEQYYYDKLKRVTEIYKTINGTHYTTLFAYNTGSQLSQITYPSGRKVYYNYDTVGHLCQVATSTSTTCNASTVYLTLPSLQYDAASRPLSATYGNSVAATAAYDPNSFALTSLTYSKGSTTLFGLNYYYQQNSTNCPTGNPTGNNGQMQCILDTVQPSRSVSYTYDSLGRLLSAKTTGGSTYYPQWGMSETYDRYGNRSAQTATVGSVPQPNFNINPVNNQITTFTYDAAGNVISTPSPTEAYTYDHEECNTGYGNSATYTCDANGMRVEKVVTGTGAVTTVYVRSGGQVLAEYDNGAAVTSPTREYLYGNNLLATVTGSTGGSGGTTIYQHRDHLSPRIYTDGNGNCVGDQGTFPFGELWYSNNDPNCTNTTGSGFIYTSYERDAESGNDYALARSYANAQGRFVAPDPLEGRVGDPQSWNRYAYVENDPINLSDPSGQGFWEDLGLAIAGAFIEAITLGNVDINSLTDPQQPGQDPGCPPFCLKGEIIGVGVGVAIGASGGGENTGPGSMGTGTDSSTTGNCPTGCSRGEVPGTDSGQGASGQGPGGTGGSGPQGPYAVGQSVPGGPVGVSIWGKMGGAIAAVWMKTVVRGGNALGDWQDRHPIATGTVGLAGIVLGGRGNPGPLEEEAEEEMVIVSRWGRQGLQAGDWVMKGRATWSNYVRSFKWTGWPNKFAPFSSGAQYSVPETAVRYPWLKEYGVGIIKGIFGQRIYLP